LFFAAWLVLISIGRVRFSRGDFASDDDWMSHESAEPSFNIDGTPMCGYVDANGNPYGVTRSSDD